MQNHNNQDKLFKNVISPPNEVKNISNNAVGNAGKDSFCVYNHQRHAVGSEIENRDGTKSICTENGSWQNSK